MSIIYFILILTMGQKHSNLDHPAVEKSFSTVELDQLRQATQEASWSEGEVVNLFRGLRTMVEFDRKAGETSFRSMHDFRQRNVPPEVCLRVWLLMNFIGDGGKVTYDLDLDEIYGVAPELESWDVEDDDGVVKREFAMMKAGLTENPERELKDPDVLYFAYDQFEQRYNRKMTGLNVVR